MRNLIKTLFAAAMAAVVITSSSVTSFAAQQEVSKMKPHTALTFSRIWVSGNVKVVLTQGQKASIASADVYDSSKMSVTTNGQTLYIKSTEPGLITLNVTVKDLQRIEAYGQSMVITSNNFDVQNLQLFLSQNARAKIKTTAASLYTVVKDDAVLKLNGTADQSTMVASNMKNVKLRAFACLKSNSYASEAIMKADRTAMLLPK